MSESKNPPRALRIVRWLSVLFGVVALDNVLFGRLGHPHVIDLSLAWWPIAFGLWREWNGARIGAIAMLVLTQLLCGMAVLTCLLMLGGRAAGTEARHGVGAELAMLAFASLSIWLLQWCIRVLCRADVRARFARAQSAPA